MIPVITMISMSEGSDLESILGNLAQEGEEAVSPSL
eukprot:CAMPEP_0184313298 /NCGR_PEP_ID=MMETSP1049-20130417/61583_1 /TAXON_ID=77928 /ORGANISM="Proteomonas sulcata, Strain CCMP704" /LENGTH=35 /DNA_ID= /DNA_START= /DNA_END= /DNA_ORIENTATION=